MTFSTVDQEQLRGLITTDPDAFAAILSQHLESLTAVCAEILDACDPLSHLRKLFDIRELQPFAGHSLGPVFKPAIAKQAQITELRATQLHRGHFSKTKTIGGNWFDYDLDPAAITAMQAALGFAKPCEFLYTQTGLSENLGKIMDTLYGPSFEDWQKGKTKICHLDTEFFSDQSLVWSCARRQIACAKRLKTPLSEDQLNPNHHMLKIPTNDDLGRYNEQDVIDYIQSHAHEIKILHLSEILFSTGQRLNIRYILTALADVIREHGIIVGLDLAHTIGNRTIDLKTLPITYAAACNYKHCSGSAGSGSGMYVREDVDLTVEHPPIQAWKAAASDQVFSKINTFDPSIMMTKGAWAFRCSNPSPMAVLEAQEYMKCMHAIGWDKLIAKSECLTRYLYELLQARLGRHITFITPLEPEKRGATLVFRVNGLKEVTTLEEMMQAPSEFGQFDIDTRPPCNIRVTAHYAYTRFTDIVNMVSRLEQVVKLVLDKQHQNKCGMFSRGNPDSSSLEHETVRARFLSKL